MAKGYWIVSVDVSNPESYKMYIAEKLQRLPHVWCSLPHTRGKVEGGLA